MHMHAGAAFSGYLWTLPTQTSGFCAFFLFFPQPLWFWLLFCPDPVYQIHIILSKLNIRSWGSLQNILLPCKSSSTRISDRHGRCVFFHTQSQPMDSVSFNSHMHSTDVIVSAALDRKRVRRPVPSAPSTHSGFHKRWSSCWSLILINLSVIVKDFPHRIPLQWFCYARGTFSSSLFFLRFYLFIWERGWESKRMRERERERAWMSRGRSRGRSRLCSSGSPIQGSIPGSQDHDLS